MWTAAWPLASAACSQAASAAVAAWPWVLSALLGLFWAARLCLYAVLVSCAWITIIENDEPRPTTRLTSEALAAKEDAERAAAGGHHRPLTPSTDLGSVSESVDSLDDLFPDEGSSVSSETGAARGAAGGRVAIPTGPVAPATPTASPATPTAPRAVAARPPVAVRPAPRAGPVTVAKVATPAAPEPSLEEEVLPEEVKAVAADKGEKQALAAAALASGGGLGGGTGTADACEPSSRHHNKRKKKKPFLNRQLDKLFQLPSAAKYNGVGVLVFKGFSSMGKRMERASGVLGKQLNSAIREAGSQAVNEVEFHMKKWFKFFGVFAFLTVALMPLPSVNVHLSFG